MKGLACSCRAVNLTVTVERVTGIGIRSTAHNYNCKV